MASSSGVSATPQKRIAFSRTRPAASTTDLSGSPVNAPASPQTPFARSVSSLYGSPGGGGFRVEEETLLVFEIGSRVISAGFAGETGPRCRISYHPDQLRRTGDYRQYAPEYQRKKRKFGKDWADAYELWRPDIRDQDLSLLGDRLERLVRNIETTYLLLDASRPRKVALVVSSQLPRPLLEIAVSCLFGALQCTHVTLFPSNTMAVVAAGLRSGLVVDIGWAESSISAISEYREVSQRRSIKASKLMVEAYAKMISDESGQQLTVEDAEDVMIRLGWCRDRSSKNDDDEKESGRKQSLHFSDFIMEVDFNTLANPPDSVLFKSASNDDDDLTLPLLAYEILLNLPVDLRHICLSRIIITGGAANVPGLKRRFLQELEHIIRDRAWDAVKNYGSAQSKRNLALADRPLNVPPSPSIATNVSEQIEDQDLNGVSSAQAAHSIPQEQDPVLAKIFKQRQAKGEELQDQSPPPGTIRAISSLGAWSGASILTNLRIRGTVEIDRDRFVAGGLLAGATTSKRDTGTGIAIQRQSLAGPPASIRQVSLDKTAHATLGIWT